MADESDKVSRRTFSLNLSIFRGNINGILRHIEFNTVALYVEHFMYNFKLCFKDFKVISDG